MKKALIIGGVILGVLVVPVLGMATTPTGDAFLGLALEEAILQLADKIDETRSDVDQNKSDSDNKLQEPQSDIEGYKRKFSTCQSIIAKCE